MATPIEDARALAPQQAESPETTQGAAPAATAAKTTPTVPAANLKPIQTLVVDTGPIIKNDPQASTLLAQAEELFTIPSVIEEIRDEATRARVQTTLLPFLTIRNPKPESIKFVSDFARRTGDLEVLSRPDLHLLALTYELECERNYGDWRLRKTPAQKGLNGKPPAAVVAAAEQEKEAAAQAKAAATTEESTKAEETPDETASKQPETASDEQSIPEIEEKAAALTLEPAPETATEAAKEDEDKKEGKEEEQEEEEDDDDDDGGEWITPSNLKKHQEKEKGGAPTQPIQKRLQAAILTSDFAMQNVALRINLNLVSPSMARITHVKTWVLRCHGCFTVTRNMQKQFCPSCGQATLTRTSCSTDSNGQFRVHLKRNFQYNKRGNVYSVPKPVHGSASGKMTDRSGHGGKNGWGRELILSEDQNEYSKKVDEQTRVRYRDMMDEDYLPGLLTGVRNNAGGRIRVGAGRNVNSKKR